MSSKASSSQKAGEKAPEPTTKPAETPKSAGIPRVPFDTAGYWESESKLNSDDRRDRYNGVSVVTLSDIPTWSDYAETIETPIDVDKMKSDLKKEFSKYEKAAVKMVGRLSDLGDRSMEKARLMSHDWDDEDLAVAWNEEALDFEASEELNSKVSIWRGDITVLEIDSIVNAANMAMRGGGGIDGRIHSVAGPSLLEECIELNGCKTGRTKVTRGHHLPARFILHTVGPRVQDSAHPLPHAKLAGCYKSCLDWVAKLELRSVAFCCISTGIFGYPIDAATHVALKTVRLWLQDPKNAASVDRIVFCCYNPPDYDLYEEMLQIYFPPILKNTDLVLPSSKKTSPLLTAFDEKITDAASLIHAIKTARNLLETPASAPEVDFRGLESLLSNLDKTTSKKFFKTTLPKIIELAKRRKELFADSSIPLLIQSIDTELELKPLQIACLMACAFLTIMPLQGIHNQAFSHFNCAGLWRGWEPSAESDSDALQSSAPVEVDGKAPSKKKKAKKNVVRSEAEATHIAALEANATARFGSLLAFFEQDFEEERIVKYLRQTVLPANPIDWRRANNKLAAMHVVNAPLQTAAAPQVALLPTFSNVSKAFFEHTPIMSRTDAFLWSVPESLVIGLLSSALLPNEVIHIEQLRPSKSMGLDEEGRFTFGAEATVNPAPLSHLLLVPQSTVSLPRHESSRFYIYDLLTRTIGALRTVKGGKKVAVQHWGHGPFARDHSAMLNLLVLLATSSFETLQAGETFKDKKKMAERLANCPELFLYSHEDGDTLGLQLHGFINVIESQKVQYQVILDSLLGVKILDVNLPETGTVLEQLTHRFANWKKEFKKYQKAKIKAEKEAEKAASKKAAARRKEIEAQKKQIAKDNKAKSAEAKNPKAKATSNSNGSASPKATANKPTAKPSAASAGSAEESEEKTTSQEHTEESEEVVSAQGSTDSSSETNDAKPTESSD